MKLITETQRAVLIENARKVDFGFDAMELRPTVKLFYPAGAATWLLAYLLPEDDNIVWGLADLGLGCPETGDIYLPELIEFRGRFGLGIERDLHFTAVKTMREYYEEARRAGAIRA